MYFHSYNLGFIQVPGLTTFNIYTIGCIHKCKGCQAEDLQDINHPDRKQLTSELIISKLDELYEGICWLGGDPLYQFNECIRINKELKESKFGNLLRIVYTGYVLEKFTQKQKQDLLSCIDIIIDGQWNGHMLGDPKCNQRIYINDKNKFKEISYEEFSKLHESIKK